MREWFSVLVGGSFGIVFCGLIISLICGRILMINWLLWLMVV